MTNQWQSVLDQQGAVRDEYGVRHFAQQSSANPETELFALDHLGCLLVEGLHARKFLQGQVTCDMDQLSSERSLSGGHCNTKGRLLFSFRAVLLAGSDNGERIALLMHRGLLAAAQQALAKFIVFSKASLSLESGHQVLGLAGAEVDQLLSQHLPVPATDTNAASQNEQGSAVRLGEDRFICVLKDNSALQLWQQHSDSCQLQGYERWNLADVRAGLGQVQPGSEDMFIPQMLNMQLTGGVSFTKGCYVGQEVVARMQYRGKLKRHMRRLELQSTVLPLVGAALYTEGSSQSVGNVVLAAPTGNYSELLAVVTDDAFDKSSLYLDEAGQQKLTPLDLPYDID